MTEMREFSPDAPKQISQAQRKQLALGALTLAALIVSFWSGVQYQKNQVTAQSPAVNTASQTEQWNTTQQGQTNQTQGRSQLDTQTN